MSFVPLRGPATLSATYPPRGAEVEFTGPTASGARVVRLPIRGAIPVLTRALRADDAHDSVGLLGAAALLALRLVAAGRIQLAESGDSWRAGPLLGEDVDAVRRLADARAPSGMTPLDAEQTVRDLIDAVADTVTRTPSAPRPVSRVDRSGWTSLEGADPRAEVVTLSLRVEAPEEQLESGSLSVVLQVHERDDQSHVADAVALWSEGGSGHGFGRGARLATTVALRAAAGHWPVLGALLRQPVPDRLLLEPDQLADLLEHGVEALRAAGIEVFWPRGLQAELVPRGRVERAPVSSDSPLHAPAFGTDAVFDFDWRLALNRGEGPDVDLEELTDAEMQALVAATTPVIRLRDNWTVLDPSVVRRVRRRLGRGPRPVTPGQAVQAALTGVLEVDGEQVEVHPGATLLRDRERIVDAATVTPIEPPEGLTATLRDYQLRGVTWLAELTGVGLGACLADDMGLGKTVTLIGLHLHRRQRDLACGPTLVVCPTSLLGNWEAEINRFAPGVAVRRFHGTRRSVPGEGEDGFVLTTYGTMRRDCGPDGAGLLAGRHWDLVVADEAQHIKNARSSTARHLRRIPSSCRVALTGTPVENELSELWAILDWATPGLLGSRAAFRKVWAAPIESGADPTVTRRFAQLVEPFLLRRRKSDPGIAPELPAKTETDQVVGLTREQVVLYTALVRDSMERIERADETTRRGLVLALLTGLKQICNHPAHYLRQDGGRLRGRSEKLELLDELLGTVLAEGGSALIFTQYVAMGRLLERHLAASGVPTLFLHGATSVRAREQMVADFQAGPEQGGAPVFLLSLRAGGTGLNLTRADHVIHFDRWWNPAVEDQATDRAHRIGQTRPVQVHRLLTQGTLEERVAALLDRKRSLADAVLDAGDAALTELSDAELRDLVTLRVEK